MAPQVGQALQKARTERGIELNEVERATKIRISFLRAMEEDRWEALPAPAYARGFISAYARFLGLDDQPLLDQYGRTAEAEDRTGPIPHKVLRPGAVMRRRRSIKPGALVRRPGAVMRRRRSIKPGALALLIVGLVGAALAGLLIVGSLGSSDNGGDLTSRRGAKSPGAAVKTGTTGEAPAAQGGQPATAQASEVSLELRSTGAVWVCLVDGEGRAPVNGETLSAGEARGPFASGAFEVTFGNGSVEMTVDGEPAEIPPVAEPIGYRITQGAVRRLKPSAQPTCL